MKLKDILFSLWGAIVTALFFLACGRFLPEAECKIVLAGAVVLGSAWLVLLVVSACEEFGT